jgi:hypothetical protein
LQHSIFGEEVGSWGRQSRWGKRERERERERGKDAGRGAGREGWELGEGEVSEMHGSKSTCDATKEGTKKKKKESQRIYEQKETLHYIYW